MMKHRSLLLGQQQRQRQRTLPGVLSTLTQNLIKTATSSAQESSLDNKYAKKRNGQSYLPISFPISFSIILVLFLLFFTIFRNSGILWQTKKNDSISLWTPTAKPPPGFQLVSSKHERFVPVPKAISRKTVFLQGKGKQTLTRVFQEAGWELVNRKELAHFVYTARVSNKTIFSTFQPYQRFSRLQGSSAFNDKDSMLEGFRAWSKLTFNDIWFLPETYMLTDGQLMPNQWLQFRKRYLEQGGRDQTWVLKNTRMDNGRGITMLPAGTHDINQITSLSNDTKAHYIIQKYLCKELTWFHGEKFDLRFYWFVASIDPLIVFLHDGYARVGANTNYSDTDFANPAEHLTNHQFRGTSENVTYDFLWQRVREFATEHHLTNFPCSNDPVEHVRSQLKQAMGSVVDAFRNTSFGEGYKMTTDNSFAVFGVDFIIDQNLDVYLIETQTSPGLGESQAYRTRLWKDLYTPILGIVEEIATKQEADPKANLYPLEVDLGGWEYVYAGDWRFGYEGYQRQHMDHRC